MHNRLGTSGTPRAKISWTKFSAFERRWAHRLMGRLFREPHTSHINVRLKILSYECFSKIFYDLGVLTVSVFFPELCVGCCSVLWAEMKYVAFGECFWLVFANHRERAKRLKFFRMNLVDSLSRKRRVLQGFSTAFLWKNVSKCALGSEPCDTPTPCQPNLAECCS